MTLIFVPLAGLAIWSETGGNPALSSLGVDQTPGLFQPGGNMEGKELRFGVVASSFLSILTTLTSCGAVNSMHDSFMPLGGFAQLFGMQLGEMVFGGVGSGFYSMIVFAIIAMFIAGLMVGRTPEYLGKKIEPIRDEALDDRHPDPDPRNPYFYCYCSPDGSRKGLLSSIPGPMDFPRSYTRFLLQRRITGVRSQDFRQTVFSIISRRQLRC